MGVVGSNYLSGGSAVRAGLGVYRRRQSEEEVSIVDIPLSAAASEYLDAFTNWLRHPSPQTLRSRFEALDKLEI